MRGFVPAGGRFALCGNIYAVTRASDLYLLRPTDSSEITALPYCWCSVCVFRASPCLCQRAVPIFGGCYGKCRPDGTDVVVTLVGPLERGFSIPFGGFSELGEPER